MMLIQERPKLIVTLDYWIETETPPIHKRGMGSVKTNFYGGEGKYYTRIQKYGVEFDNVNSQYDYEWLIDEWYLRDATVLTEDPRSDLRYVENPLAKPPTDKTKWAEWLDDVRKRDLIEWDTIESHDYGFEQEMEVEMQFLTNEEEG